jgi:hypothetical protein
MNDDTLYCHDYVNQPYARVRDALLTGTGDVFRRATTTTGTDAAALHVRIGGIELGTTIAIELSSVGGDRVYSQPATKLQIEWKSVNHPNLFPVMKASLVVFALSPGETQLELRGAYRPPLGALGEVFDAAIGHRIAEAAATRFVEDVAAWLRESLAAPVAGAEIAPPAPRAGQVDLEC